MSFISNALGGNPFSTPVGSKIEQATDGTLASENWALNMEICDLVNETEDGPRDAIKAIRKRLQQSAGKNYTIVMYTLTVLETCVKNCGKPFHVLACSKDFVQELVKLIGPKNDPPTAVQEKVLSLIQSWADAFRPYPELSGVVQVYQDLLAKGIEFPATDLDSMAPIHTPERFVDREPSSPRSHAVQTPEVPSPTGSIVTPEQRAKIRSELDVVQSNMGVLGELLSEIKPGQGQPDEMELLQELNVTCHSMQERLVELISKLSNDELTGELLRINDDLNNLFLRYSRWEKNREAGGQSASAVLAKAMGPTPKANNTSTDDSLIDFGPPENLTDELSKLDIKDLTASAQLAQLESLSARNGSQKDEFDMFAQSRNATYESSKASGSTYKDNLNPDQVSGGLSSVTNSRPSNPRELEFDEMEAWLGEQPPSTTEESVTSSEFERFLAERAAAAESLPTTTSATTATTANASKGTKSGKDGLFAL